MVLWKSLSITGIAVVALLSPSYALAGPQIPTNAKAKPLVVTDVAWERTPIVSMQGEIFTQVVFVFRNPNSRQFAEFPTFRVTAKSVNGSIVYSDSWVTSDLPPSQIGAMSIQLATRQAPATVQVQFLKATWIKSRPVASRFPAFAGSNITVTPATATELVITGELQNPYPVDFKEVTTLVLLRDPSGQIVGAGSDYVDLVGPGSTPFSMELGTWIDAPYVTTQLIATPHADWTLRDFAVTGKLR